ncbi:hypothetical protein ACFYZH_15510 [Streptomyces abikoensis]|uniref:hypothetical protein n=1 Tax=Streptomyces abikoensis TaxID=97398 RepID=UPI0036AA3BAE
MLTTKKRVLSAFSAISALGALGLAAPQAQAAETIQFSPKASAAARTIAKADVKAAARAGNVCGSGWNLYNAEQLPEPNRRFGTLFTYTRDSGGGSDTPTCAIFDNNTGSKKYMKIKLCSNYTDTPCKSDEGWFSEYAGPVYQDRGGCGDVYAIMKDSAGGVLIDAKRGATSCD